VEQDVPKNEVIDSMDNHDDGLFANQLDQLNQLVNPNEIIVNKDIFLKMFTILNFIFYSIETKEIRNKLLATIF
jgi:hypothetical protein